MKNEKNKKNFSLSMLDVALEDLKQGGAKGISFEKLWKNVCLKLGYEENDIDNKTSFCNQLSLDGRFVGAFKNKKLYFISRDNVTYDEAHIVDTNPSYIEADDTHFESNQEARDEESGNSKKEIKSVDEDTDNGDNY